MKHVVVAQRGFSAQVEIKIGIRRDEKIRFARINSSSGNNTLSRSHRFVCACVAPSTSNVATTDNDNALKTIHIFLYAE